MSETFHRVIDLVVHLHEVQISEHGYDEMIQDDIYARDVLAGLIGGSRH